MSNLQEKLDAIESNDLLSPAKKILLKTLLTFSDTGSLYFGGTKVTMTIVRLKKLTLLSRTSIYYNLYKLKDEGYIDWEKQQGKNLSTFIINNSRIDKMILSYHKYMENLKLYKQSETIFLKQ